MIGQSFAYTTDYHVIGRQFSEIPLVCTIQPVMENDSNLKQWAKDYLLKSAQLSVQDWQSALQISEKQNMKNNWKIDYKELQGTENDKNCNIIIRFAKTALSQEGQLKVLGNTYLNYEKSGKNIIDVYYSNVQLCKSPHDDNSYEKCHDNEIIPFDKIRTTITHELGHALGLGHYTTDDYLRNQSWAKGVTDAESIMVEFSPENPKLMKIKQIDVDKIKSIYGNGFKLNLDTTNKFESFFVSKPEYNTNGDTNFITITGIVNKTDSYGQNVLIHEFLPDGHMEEFKISPLNSGLFSLQIRVDQTMPKGIYSVQADYQGWNSERIFFVVLDESEHSLIKDGVIPDWIKTTSKSWSMGNLDDETFVYGLQFMIKYNLIEIEPAHKIQSGSSTIHYWIKNNAKWWSEDKITDHEFVNVIEYLINYGFIKMT